MMPYVITLTGPSQCGKSEVIRILKSLSQETMFSDFKPVIFQKYTTRKFRKEEVDLIKNGQANLLDQRPVIGEYNCDNSMDEIELLKAKELAFQNLRCDLAYEQYGVKYGLRLSDLYEHLKLGETPIVVLNDVRTVEDVKTKLGKQCFSIFIFREVPNAQHFFEIGNKRGDSEQEIKLRLQKAESIYRIYIENIHIFDKLILNVDNGLSNNFKSLEMILRQLILYLCKPLPEFC